MSKVYYEKTIPLDKGMGVAVARRTVFREEDNEDMAKVAERVTAGNIGLVDPEFIELHEQSDLSSLISNGGFISSGRHLQHGDELQRTRNMELYTNCSTAAVSFAKFYLLLNGSGVGRSYDDQMMLVDWDKAPNLHIHIDQNHKDWPHSPEALYQFGKDWGQLSYDLKFSDFDSERQHHMRHTMDLMFNTKPTGSSVVTHVVDDSREGWAKALEIYEAAAYSGEFSDLVLVFSAVRPCGTPIAGMQDRPASGPFSVMRAFHNVKTKVVGKKLKPWKQAMYVDHFVSVEVQVGGARRAARMATKDWRDKDIMEFIRIKQDCGLWTSNNSVTVDRDFWEAVDREDPRATAIFNAMIDSSWENGEPGFINSDKLESNTNGRGKERPAVIDFGSDKYTSCWGRKLIEDTAVASQKMSHPMIVNPCVTADTIVLTSEGPKPVSELIDTPFTAVVNGENYPATGFWKTGDKKVFRLKTDRGYELRATDNHKVLIETDRKQLSGKGLYSVTTEWVEIKNLFEGDKVVIHNHRGLEVHNDEEFSKGWILGEILGDGGHNPEATYNSYVRFWGDEAAELAELAVDIIQKLDGTIRSDFAGVESKGIYTVGCKALTEFTNQYLEPGTKNIRPELEKASVNLVRGFLRGLFDADGSVQGSTSKGRSVRLAQSDQLRLQTVQRMLLRVGIASSIYPRKEAGKGMLPDGRGGSKEYQIKDQYELVISKDNLTVFAELIGFTTPSKSEKLNQLLSENTRGEYQERFTAKVVAVLEEGVEPVYDCTVNEVHAFDANGIMAHNCGEIELHVMGGYCVIGDVAPLNCDAGNGDPDTWDLNFLEACRLATRFLMRVNQMDSLYNKEVARTNRIGVSLTGIFEYAWKRWGMTFEDLLIEARSKDFWEMIRMASQTVRDEAKRYAKVLGVGVPHTALTIKPAGTTSKLYGLSEGAHLPAYAYYIRWVQYRGHKDVNGNWTSDSDPLLAQYEAKGYPVRELQTFQGMSIVGFPTVPKISQIGLLEDWIVTAPEASPEDQYKWLQLLEKYWLGDEMGNQISYTMKVFTDRMDKNEYARLVFQNQPKVRACTLMPSLPEEEMGYEYIPEQPVSLEEFQKIVDNINDPELDQDLDMETLQCASGACPI